MQSIHHTLPGLTNRHVLHKAEYVLENWESLLDWRHGTRFLHRAVRKQSETPAAKRRPARKRHRWHGFCALRVKALCGSSRTLSTGTAGGSEVWGSGDLSLYPCGTLRGGGGVGSSASRTGLEITFGYRRRVRENRGDGALCWFTGIGIWSGCSGAGSTGAEPEQQQAFTEADLSWRGKKEKKKERGNMER